VFVVFVPGARLSADCVRDCKDHDRDNEYFCPNETCPTYIYQQEKWCPSGSWVNHDDCTGAEPDENYKDYTEYTYGWTESSTEEGYYCKVSGEWTFCGETQCEGGAGCTWYGENECACKDMSSESFMGLNLCTY